MCPSNTGSFQNVFINIMYLWNVTPRGLINLQGRTVSHSVMDM